MGSISRDCPHPFIHVVEEIVTEKGNFFSIWKTKGSLVLNFPYPSAIDRVIDLIGVLKKKP